MKKVRLLSPDEIRGNSWSINLLDEGQTIIAEYDGTIPPGSTSERLGDQEAITVLFVLQGEGELRVSNHYEPIAAGEKAVFSPNEYFTITNSNKKTGLRIQITMIKEEV